MNEAVRSPPTRAIVRSVWRSMVPAGLLSLALIAIVYWPARHAGFVWDDLTAFVENDWLVDGDQWRHYVLRDFHGWVNYFRPLGVVGFTLQARLFESQPGPMHLVSLALHLAGTTLVGLIVAHCTRALRLDGSLRATWTAACMLLYGLHPALTESVAWISSQFELLLVIFSLSAILAAIAVPTGVLRALTIGTAFFLAACSKETAVVLPALVLLFDWVYMRRTHSRAAPPLSGRVFVRRNAGALTAMVAAGLIYLGLRHHGLGHLLAPAPMYGGDLSLLGTVQKITWTWASYLKLLLLPAQHLDAVHSFDPEDFTVARPGLLAFAAASVMLVGWATRAALARGTPVACLILALFLGVFPTLNILPTGYAVSLYHDRYIMLALAACCSMLPLIPWPRVKGIGSQRALAIGAVVAITWVAASVVTIRGALPVWKDDESLWRSAIKGSSANEVVQYNLVVALLRNGQLEAAVTHGDRFAEAGSACTRCDIEVASFLLDGGRPDRAALFLERASSSASLGTDLDLRGRYQLIAGQLAFTEARYEDAITLLRRSIAITPKESLAHYLLAESLAMAGDWPSAAAAADAALAAARDDQRAVLHQWRSLLVQRDANRPDEGSGPAR